MATMEMPLSLHTSNEEDGDSLQDVPLHATDQTPHFRPANKRDQTTLLYNPPPNRFHQIATQTLTLSYNLGLPRRPLNHPPQPQLQRLPPSSPHFPHPHLFQLHLDQPSSCAPPHPTNLHPQRPPNHHYLPPR